MPVMYVKCQNKGLLFKVSIKLLLMSLVTSAVIRVSLLAVMDLGFRDTSIDGGP